MIDKNKFALLLRKAKGPERSLNQYAIDSGVSSAHISRLLRGLLDTPPTPQTIEKLAEHAFGGVTYEQFMEAAGYGTVIKEGKCKYETSKKIASLIPKLEDLSGEDLQALERLIDSILRKNYDRGSEDAATAEVIPFYAGNGDGG